MDVEGEVIHRLEFVVYEFALRLEFGKLPGGLCDVLFLGVAGFVEVALIGRDGRAVYGAC